MSRRFALLIVSLGLSMLWNSIAAAQYGDLIRRIPYEANAVIVLDVGKIHDSPIGKAESWRGQHEKRFEAGLSMVPPSAEHYIVASKMDFEYMTPVWTSAVMDVSYEVSMPELSVWAGGEMDEIEGQAAVRMPTDAYVIKFGVNKMGTMRPGNRQETTNWIRNVYKFSQREPLTPYLAEAVGYVQDLGTPIIMAVDLDGVVSADRVRSRLDELSKESGGVDLSNVDLDAAAKVLAGIRGAMLGVTLRDKVNGKIKVDFGEDVAPIAPIAKPLLLAVLAEQGAMIEEFNDWQVQAGGKLITLEGELLPSGRRRMMSLLDAPAELHQAVSQGQTGGGQPGAQGEGGGKTDEEKQKQLTIAATKQYFNSLVTLIDDIRGQRQSSDFHTWGQVGLWFERYATRIDELPTLNVDPEAVQFGQWISTQFRASESAMKGIGPQSRIAQQRVPTQYNTRTTYTPIGVNFWGPTGVYNTVSQVDNRATGEAKARARTQVKIQGNMQANMSMQGMQQAVGDMRRYLTQKYNVQF
ncbi:MAG: hypothetical protein RIC55_07610 [Pirellulaceae bacterium]